MFVAATASLAEVMGPILCVKPGVSKSSISNLRTLHNLAKWHQLQNGKDSASRSEIMRNPRDKAAVVIHLMLGDVQKGTTDLYTIPSLKFVLCRNAPPGNLQYPLAAPRYTDSPWNRKTRALLRIGWTEVITTESLFSQTYTTEHQQIRCLDLYCIT